VLKFSRLIIQSTVKLQGTYMYQETQTLVKRMQAYLSGESSEATAIMKDAIKLLMKQPEAFSWKLEPSEYPCGLVRYMTDSKYKMQTASIQQWYRPIRPEINLPYTLVIRDAGDHWSEGYDNGWNECLAEIKRLNNL
jgi:hypothetical protein